MGAKRLGGKRLGGKRLGGETTRGRNGLGAKRPGFLPGVAYLLPGFAIFERSKKFVLTDQSPRIFHHFDSYSFKEQVIFLDNVKIT